MFFDTHAHYDDEQFDPDREQLLNDLHAQGISYILNPGASLISSEKGIRIAERFDFVYAAAGVHPQEAQTLDALGLSVLSDLLGHKKVRALGEIGLDYFYNQPAREVQMTAFRAQMELARAHNLPVIIHDRDAHEDTLKVVRDFPQVRGVFHCYSGSLELAKELVKVGYSLSFTGSITFKNARRLPEVAAWLPEDRIMIETDSPYLAPEPCRGRRNHSGYLPHICRKVADIRGISLEAAAALTLHNGKAFFGID